MKKKHLSPGLIILLLLLVSCKSSAQNEGQVLVHKIPSGQEISVDGVVNEEEWAYARSFSLQVSTGEKVDYFQEAKALLTWDEKAIYVAFIVEDSHIVANISERDGPVYYDDCVELFLAPLHNYDSLYFGWEMNSAGTWYDFVFFPNHVNQTNLILPAFSPENIHLKTSKTPEGAEKPGWMLEASIPVEAFGNFTRISPLEAGNRWKFQLSRWDYQEETSLFSSYTITGETSPHVFSKMAILEFAE